MKIYQDKNQPTEKRVADLLSIMTLKEKIGQLNQKMHGWNAFKIVDGKPVLTQAFKDEVAFGDGLGAIYGISRADGWNSHLTMGISSKESVLVANEVQKYMIENTRLGIPLLLSEECPHGHEAVESTTFPTNIGIGSSWNTDLYREVCAIISKELRARGGHLALISTLDIATDPRWGRTEECYSEDPCLSSRFCEQAVYGVQGYDESELKTQDKSAIVLKHFCAQGATIGGHNGKSTNIGQRELYEIHLQGMMKGAKAGALGCMAAYNDIDGIPCHINHKLLTDILRGEFGFKGLVMSDGHGADRLNAITGSSEKAGAGAVHAGVDLNLWNDCYLKLEDAVKDGYLTESDIDLAVSRILSVKFKLGLFENPYIDDNTQNIVGSVQSQQVALKIARECIVLLENRNNTLPIKNNVKKIAVIGPNSDKMYNQLGDYTQWKTSDEVTTVLDGIRKNSPEKCEVLFAHGCDIRSMSTDGFDEAIDIAQKSDVVVLVLGGSSTREPGMTFEDNGAVFMNSFTSELDCGEAVDLADINLGGVQVELAKKLKQTGKPIVTVLIEGRPHSVKWLKENSDALLTAFYPGQRGGDAVAEILFGKTTPSGKLSMSVPESVAQLPVYYNRKDMSKYVDMSAHPLYPFGYGLSYTHFDYSDFKVNNQSIKQDDLLNGSKFEFEVKVTNTGDFDGKEIVQLYIHDMESCITRRLKELKDFVKVEIKKGDYKIVKLSLSADDLKIYDYDMNFVLEKGHVKVMIGSSSENILNEQIIEIV